VITGAAGSIGTAISDPLSKRWDLVATDVRQAGGVVRLDLTDASACREVFGGAHAVVHLTANPDPEASWEELLPANLVAVHEVATAAAAVGVSRLVLASSLHAVSGYPAERQIRSVDVARPGNL
jgi:nucleoside-diphosphate-sugar epimerase